MFCGVYVIYRNKMYDDNSMKAGREKWEYIVVRFLYYMGRVD